jgi:hypothetical protein
MQGQFELTVLDAEGYCDEDFKTLQSKGKVMDLVQRLPVAQQVKTKNRVFDNMAAYLLDKLFSCPNSPEPYYRDAGKAALAFIAPLTTDGATSDYEEHVPHTYTYARNAVDIVVVADATVKRFVEDQITGFVVWTDATREAVHFRNRWLYLPTEAVSSNIRSIGIFFSDNGDNKTSNYRYHSRLGRVRLTNSGGVPIVLNKSASQVLLIEYTFSLVSV